MAAVLLPDTHEYDVETAGFGVRPQLELAGGSMVPGSAVVPSQAVMGRRRLMAAVFVGLFVWLLVTAATTAMSFAGGVPTVLGGDPITHVVQPGDTVWSIARQHYPTGDIRGVVSRIVDSSGAALIPGQLIVVNP
ncbi:MAG: LysM peptidoglycan-binding domain-containing protein [Actinomycetia bacterium]|nr:LysM peptidoglycan-binding domain-containing protein [Actinomycetes bacterium]MCP4959950.1 LysM peptidoglycan-binding domain-containing protein [Actinomycetes bacterium]